MNIDLELKAQADKIKALEDKLAEVTGEKAKPFVPQPHVPFDPLDRVFAEQGLHGQLPEWQRDAVAAVPDAQVRAILNDNRATRNVQPVAEEPKRGSTNGWQEQRPLVQPYLRECDRIADAFDRKDRGR
jgi:hypothetical protein